MVLGSTFGGSSLRSCACQYIYKLIELVFMHTTSPSFANVSEGSTDIRTMPSGPRNLSNMTQSCSGRNLDGLRGNVSSFLFPGYFGTLRGCTVGERRAQAVKTWSCKQLYIGMVSKAVELIPLPSRKIYRAGSRKLIRCRLASPHPGCMEIINETCPQGK
jgi:hypothetical protein